MGRSSIASTEDHPYCNDILGILARTVELDDESLRALALAWKDDLSVAQARDKALQPDSPLVVEVLTAFDSIAMLFADDLAGEVEYVTVPAPVTALALKAVRDVVAATYARPVLTDDEYAALSRPWRKVFPAPGPSMPDFGPQHTEVVSLLAAIPTLACHTHDAEASALWQSMLDLADSLDRDGHELAIEAAWQAAVLSGRRRLWGLVTRSCQEGYGRNCSQCNRAMTEQDVVVLTLCLGAAAATLVRDLLDDASAEMLIGPAAPLLGPSAAAA